MFQQEKKAIKALLKMSDQFQIAAQTQKLVVIAGK
jgi:hypothetical protein